MKTLIKGLLCTLTLAGCLCAQAQDKGILALTGSERLLPGDGMFTLGAAVECVLSAAGRTRRSALATEKKDAR